MNNPSARALRDAFGSFMTGVTVVTTCDPQLGAIGFTANSFTSVSLDPPMLLVCLAKSSYYHTSFSQGVGFAVNVLSEAQQDIAQRFASRDAKRFAAVDWLQTPAGMPLLADGVAWFDCRRVNAVDGGDHTIIIGEVTDFHNGAGKGLGYVRGSFFTLSMEERAAQISQSDQLVEVQVIIEKQGEIFFKEGANNTFELPRTTVVKGESLQMQLKSLTQQCDFPDSASYVYSIYENIEENKQFIVYHTVTETASRQGTFMPLNDEVYQSIQSPPEVIMLKRFAAESEVGEFGLYVGDHKKGKVFPT